jgi:hypothetical protein
MADSTTMAQKQYTVLIPEDLATLIEVYQAQTGATFKSIVTAALFQWVFHGFLDAPYNADMGEPTADPDSIWMRVQTAVAKGEIAVGDIPATLLTSVAYSAQRWAAATTDNPDRRRWHLERAQRADALRVAWERRIEGSPDPLSAICDQLTWSPPRLKKGIQPPADAPVVGHDEKETEVTDTE